MKKPFRPLMLATAIGTLTAPLLLQSAFAAETLADAFTQGKANLSTRTRFEWVKDDGFKEKAEALTNRTVFGYKTAETMGFVAGLEFENVFHLADEHYNSGTTGHGNAKTQYPTVADPDLTQVNQAYLDWKGLKLGRQKVVVDNARFIGDVGWRQNDQTFDAVTYTNADLIPKTTFSLGYLHKVNTISGASRKVSAPMLTLKFSPVKEHSITALYYGVDEKTAPASSWQHLGLRANGSLSDFIYDVAYAHQNDYADGTTPDANYYDLQLGYKIQGWTIKAQHEVLKPGFKTPLATLHAYNGWVDKFLSTPAKGLKDTNLKVSTKAWDTMFTVALHDFRAEDGGQKFGRELDLMVSKDWTDRFSTLIKYGNYRAASGAPGTLGKSAQKIWLQTQYKFL